VLDPLFQGLAWLIAQFYALVPSYGLAIALLTITVMVLLAPLTVKSTRSMLAMQKLQPEIRRLQAEHKNDRVALNEAMMAFYKEHKVNPLGGCLPVLLQMPVFLVMYNVIQGLTHTPEPKYLSESTRLFRDLVADHLDGAARMVSFGMDLAKSASSVGGSFTDALPYYVLVALVVATGYYQSRQMMARNPAANDPNNVQARQMATLQKIFPVMFGFISFNIQAGVVVYFVVSNVFRIVQQTLMYRYDPVIKSTVGLEVREVEAKAREIKKNRGASTKKALTKESSKNKAPAQSGRVTPKGGRNKKKRGR
jgi:YidC/Oxa1 family membrane protein insertase